MGSGGDEEAAAGADVLGERVFEKRRERVEVGENDEGVVGRLAVGGFVDVDGFENEGRLRGRGKCRSDVERRAVVAVIVDEQGLLRVGAFDGETAEIVGGERVGGIDLDFAAAEAVGHFERRGSRRWRVRWRERHGLVAVVLPFTTSDTVRCAAGVP